MFWKQVHWRALYLTYALFTKRTMTQHSDGYNYAIGTLCTKSREPCFFGPVSSCPQTGKVMRFLTTVDQNDRMVHVSGRAPQIFGSDAYIWPESMFPVEVLFCRARIIFLPRLLKDEVKVYFRTDILRCSRKISSGRSAVAGFEVH